MATAYLSPGVYVEEVDRGSKPIEGVGTAVAAFIGFAEKGPVGYPTLITNWCPRPRCRISHTLIHNTAIKIATSPDPTSNE